MSLLYDIVNDYTLRNVALGSVVLGVVSGVLGCFAVLRKQGLMGDALSHAALPGVCLAYMITGSKASITLMLGAAAAGWIGMLAILQITRRTRIDPGSALGIILTVFFGLGIVLLTVIQKGNDANQAGLDKFLFGQAAALVAEQVTTMSIIGGGALAVTVLMFKEFKLLAFDAEFAESIGMKTHALGTLLTGLLVVSIVIGLNTVGVILMSAMLVAPASAARQWTNSLSHMVVYAALIGATAGLVGAVVSVLEKGIPTGPAIVICLAILVVVSLLFGSAQGLIWQWTRRRRRKLVLPT
ncbi:MAG: metal ABC transporter permease [Fimbriimonadaceae bacterium]|nr:metal ABC transporter permease [Fimbriimonadaceae bacterium]